MVPQRYIRIRFNARAVNYQPYVRSYIIPELFDCLLIIALIAYYTDHVRIR